MRNSPLLSKGNSVLKYSKQYTVNWHDTNANRELTPSKLLTYMQETANWHLRDHGLSLDALRDQKGLAFILSRISILIQKPLHTGDGIEVKTWVADGRGFGFDRYFEVFCNGESVAQAYSVWALLDLAQKRMLRTDEFTYGFEGDAPLLAPFVTRVHPPSSLPLEAVGRRPIVYSDIDYNMHMNNCNYPDMLCDFVPQIEQKRLTGITLSFVREASYGQTVELLRGEREGGYGFRALRPDGTVCLEALLSLEPIATECPKGGAGVEAQSEN